MAYQVDAYGAGPKVRNPLGVVGLTLITIGIYYLVWYYKINKELKEYGRAYNDRELAESNPTNSLLAQVPGFLLIVPPVISLYRTVGRVRRVERIGQSELTSGWMVLVLYLLIGIAVPAYIQSGLNELWRRYPHAEGPDPALPPAPGDPVATTPPAPSDAQLADAPPPAAPPPQTPPPETPPPSAPPE